MHRTVCYRTIALHAAERIHDHEYTNSEDGEWHDGLHKLWAKEWSPATPAHFKDGVDIWVEDSPQESD